MTDALGRVYCAHIVERIHCNVLSFGYEDLQQHASDLIGKQFDQPMNYELCAHKPRKKIPQRISIYRYFWSF